MPIKTSSALLNELSKLSSELMNKVSKSLLHLSPQQRNWRPNSATWNINEIFWHLNSYAIFYDHAFTSKIKRTRFKNFSEKFVSSPLGKSAWKSIKLGNAHNVKRRFKAPKDFNPTFHKEGVKENEMELFIEHQQTMLQVIEMARTVNIRKVKIPLSMSKMIRLRLGDCLQFVIYHNERHVQQALNLIEHRGFPKKQ